MFSKMRTVCVLSLTAIAVTAAILSAVVWKEAEKKPERFARFLAEGRRIACGARP